MAHPVYGESVQLGIDTVATPTHRFDLFDETVVMAEQHLDASGLLGTRSHSVYRNRASIRRIAGPIILEPTPNELALILPWALGGTPAGSPTVTYPVAEILSSRYVVCDRSNALWGGSAGQVFTYTSAVVDKLRITGRQAEALRFTLDVVGVDESIASAGSFPTLSIDTATTEFMFSDLVFSVNNVTYNVEEIDLTIDNQIDKERFWNSLTATALIATDRRVTLNYSLGHGDASAAYNLGPSGTQVVLTFTNGGAVLTITLPALAAPRDSPHSRGRGEILQPFRGVALATNSSKEIVVSLNPGP